jgi:hypothetical protein
VEHVLDFPATRPENALGRADAREGASGKGARFWFEIPAAAG